MKEKLKQWLKEKLVIICIVLYIGFAIGGFLIIKHCYTSKSQPTQQVVNGEITEQTPKKYKIIITNNKEDKLTERELLSYFATILAGFGTILIGLVAFDQSKRANDISEKVNKNSEDLKKMQEENYIPNIIVKGFKSELIESSSEKETTFRNEHVNYYTIPIKNGSSNKQIYYNRYLFDSDDSPTDKHIICEYFLNLSYTGKIAIKQVEINCIYFFNKEHDKPIFKYKCETILNNSLVEGQDFNIGIGFKNFSEKIKDNSNFFNILLSDEISIKFKLTTLNDETYIQDLRIYKIFTCDGTLLSNSKFKEYLNKNIILNKYKQHMLSYSFNTKKDYS